MPEYKRHETIPKQHELLTRYNKTLAQLLFNRNLNHLDDADAFLSPNYEDNYDPLLLKDMEKVVERLFRAITNNEFITIYADYDADGIPGSIVLSSLLEKISYPHYSIYIPHRHDEGYGIHVDALKKIKEKGTSLIISIDVGITAHEAADWCNNNNIDLIITDHHLPEMRDGQEILPQSYALVNPKRCECNYPDTMLCGSGVIFKCVQGFLAQHREQFDVPEGWEKWLLDMVGIATISDMVPLQNENRIFAHYGLKVLQKTRRRGLEKLMWDAGISKQHINEEDVAFGISPKINAASRMGHPEDAVSVFMAQDDVSATTAVKYLNSLNTKRKSLVAKTVKQAYAKLENRTLSDIIVVGHPDWQAGILGLVASKLVEKYRVPVFVWSEENGVIKGSCRGVSGIDLVELMGRSDPQSFIQCGGHKEAGGFSCEKNEIHFLEERLSDALTKIAKKTEQEKEDDAVVFFDDEISINEINDDFYQEIRQLGPFGIGNEKPLFLIKDIIPEYVGTFGKQKEHLEIRFKNQRGRAIRAIAFFSGVDDYRNKPGEQKACSLLGHIEQSFFRGKKELRIKIVDCL